MSLVTLALRVITVRALMNATQAADRVYDSDIGSVDTRLKGSRKPFLTVYTDEERTQVDGNGLFGGDKSIRIAIEAVIAEVVPVTDKDGEVILTYPSTDATIELQLDFMRRQITRTLMDPANPWSDLWRTFVTKVKTLDVQRGASGEDGVRFGAKQVSLTVDTVDDPLPGAPLEGAWLTLVEALEAEPYLAKIGRLIRAEIEGNAMAGIEAFELAQQAKGTTNAGMVAVGLGRLSTTGKPTFDRATIAGDLGNRDVTP